MDSTKDIFESSLYLEETHFKKGYGEGYADGLISGKEEGRQVGLRTGFGEGYADGLISGKEEGRQVGLRTGFEAGEELGFYRGCVDVWNSAIRADPNLISGRHQRTIKKMDELIQKYLVLEPENESVSEVMNSLRLKFRAICASLNVKLEYSGYPKSSDSGNIEF